MINTSQRLLATVLVLAAAGAGYFWWDRQAPAPLPAPVAAVPPPAVAPTTTAPPAIQHPLEPDATAAAPLPTLADSDTGLATDLAGLVGAKPWQALFFPDRIIRRIVASVDNLPRQEAPVSMWPLRPVGTWLKTTAAGETLVIDTSNARRYDAHARMVKALDVQALAALYRRLYPLFQQAYVELGYPQGYFNDRLIFAIDDLLATPESVAPLALVQPKVYYRFADPDLERRSAGQKILLRIGVEHARTVKTHLREFRQAVATVPAPAAQVGSR